MNEWIKNDDDELNQNGVDTEQEESMEEEWNSTTEGNIETIDSTRAQPRLIIRAEVCEE